MVPARRGHRELGRPRAATHSRVRQRHGVRSASCRGGRGHCAASSHGPRRWHTKGLAATTSHAALYFTGRLRGFLRIPRFVLSLRVSVQLIIMPLPAASETAKRPKTAIRHVSPPKAAVIGLNLLRPPSSAFRGHGRMCTATVHFLPCFTVAIYLKRLRPFPHGHDTRIHCSTMMYPTRHDPPFV